MHARWWIFLRKWMFVQDILTILCCAEQICCWFLVTTVWIHHETPHGSSLIFVSMISFNEKSQSRPIQVISRIVSLHPHISLRLLQISMQHAACIMLHWNRLSVVCIESHGHGALPFLSLVNDCPLPAPHHMQTELSHDITAMSAWYSSRLLSTGKCVILRLFVSLIFARTACARELWMIHS